MKLWRLVRAPYTVLDGAGPQRYGARYSPPGVPVVNFASEPGLAVLIAMRYLPEDRTDWPDDFVLGWTEVFTAPERGPVTLGGEEQIRVWVADWLASQRSLCAATASRVLPEADVVMINPRHPGAAGIAPLTSRHFDFDKCLHRPPMLDTYRSQS